MFVEKILATSSSSACFLSILTFLFLGSFNPHPSIIVLLVWNSSATHLSLCSKASETINSGATHPTKRFWVNNDSCYKRGTRHDLCYKVAFFARSLCQFRLLMSLLQRNAVVQFSCLQARSEKRNSVFLQCESLIFVRWKMKFYSSKDFLLFSFKQNEQRIDRKW